MGIRILAPPGPPPPNRPAGTMYDDELGYFIIVSDEPAPAPPQTIPPQVSNPEPPPASAPVLVTAGGWTGLVDPRNGIPIGAGIPVPGDPVIPGSPEFGVFPTQAEIDAVLVAQNAAPVDENDGHSYAETDSVWTDDAFEEWELEAQAWEDGVRALTMGVLRSPGQIISTVADHRGRALGDWESDNALDIYLLVGTQITAVAPGYVSGAVGPCGGAKTRSGPSTKCSGRGYGLCDPNPKSIRAGNRLAVCHDNGMMSFYHHMTDLVAKPGARVAQGDILGYSGAANGTPHLHFAVNPPYDPNAFYVRAFRLSGRKPITVKPPTTPVGDIPISGTTYANPKLEDSWSNFMAVFAYALPAASKTVKTVRQTLLDVLR
jgi:murein DD-endopeptidase MepM/ murein hydrolase activator NlpD